MASSPEVFTKIVEAVLNSWTALRLAVEHGTGGFQSKEVALQLVNDIVYLFDKNENIDVEDVADYLSDFMDSNFETLCEDNSPNEVAAVLYQFHKHYKEGNHEVIDLELGKLQKCNIWLSKQQPSQRSSVNQTNSCDMNNETVMEMEEEEDPEWTHVKSRRRKEKVPVE